MKLLHLNSYYSYYGSPGFYKNLFERQVAKRIEISVFVPLDHSLKINNNEFGTYTKVVETHKPKDRYFYKRKQKKMLESALHHYAVNKYDLIHAHSVFSNGYLAYKLNQKFNIPYIVAVRDTDVNIFFKKMPHLRKLGNEILINANKVIFLSSSYKQQTIDNYVTKKYKETINKKTEIIPNGIDSYWLKNKPKSKNKKNNINLLFVGRLSKRKNPILTAQAAQLLNKKGYEVNFNIAGPIDDLKQQKKLSKYRFVNFMGEKNKEELLEVYRENDIFIMPSTRETFGLVYPEAMSQGLPVIYTKGQGFYGQFAEGKVGYGVSPNSPKELAEKIEKIINNYSDISKNCLQDSKAFDWDIIEQKYHQLYEDILK